METLLFYFLLFYPKPNNFPNIERYYYSISGPLLGPLTPFIPSQVFHHLIPELCICRVVPF